MQSTELTDYHATAYTGNRKLCNCIFNCTTVYSTFWLEKAIKNDIMTSVYHEWYDVATTWYPPACTACRLTSDFRDVERPLGNL